MKRGEEVGAIATHGKRGGALFASGELERIKLVGPANLGSLRCRVVGHHRQRLAGA
jgi:hypothetical protein